MPLTQIERFHILCVDVSSIAPASPSSGLNIDKY